MAERHLVLRSSGPIADSGDHNPRPHPHRTAQATERRRDGPSAAAGIDTLLGLDTETIYQAIGQALHTTTATRQARKGEISSWKVYAPAFAGKMAVEAVDRTMRGEGVPSPIWEGEDGVIVWLLGGPDKEYSVPLPGPGEPKRGILDSYIKEHSAEYQCGLRPSRRPASAAARSFPPRPAASRPWWARRGSRRRAA